jgi:hypothetical protein
MGPSSYHDQVYIFDTFDDTLPIHLSRQDSYRLPDGLVRTGYDADTSRYMYRDTETGESYIGAPGVEYGPLQLVVDEQPPSRLLPHGEANKDSE